MSWKPASQDKIDELRERVPCAALLEREGFAVDLKESTRRAVKYRRGGEIVIVNHEGRGWFDPLSDAKGDVFSLARHLGAAGFAQALRHVASLVGFELEEPAWDRPARPRRSDLSIPDRWRSYRAPWAGSRSWGYLTGARTLPAEILHAAIAQDLLREGPYGSVWAAHADEAGSVIGWEERGPGWRGFSTGGAKAVFRLGAMESSRLCVTEAALDALSLAAIERLRSDSLYLSTGGGWSPSTQAAIEALAVRSGTQLVAATDADTQGDAFADRLERLAVAAGCVYMRLRPQDDDWNAMLKSGHAGAGR